LVALGGGVSRSLSSAGFVFWREKCVAIGVYVLHG
jgi:hypothetical protein